MARGTRVVVIGIDMAQFYCRDGQCPVAIGNVQVYRDVNHVTKQYWRTVLPHLLRMIDAALVEEASASPPPEQAAAPAPLRAIGAASR